MWARGVLDDVVEEGRRDRLLVEVQVRAERATPSGWSMKSDPRAPLLALVRVAAKPERP